MPKKKSHRIQHNQNRSKTGKLIISTCIVLGSVCAFVFHILGNNTSHNVCANSISCINNLTGEYKPLQTGEFMGKKVSPPEFMAYTRPDIANVLGDATSQNKKIYVDLTNQRLYAYEGDKMVYNFLISSGKWYPTPTGDFTIWIKLRYTLMQGGSKENHTYYNLPNVPYTMFFYNSEIPKSRGFGIHGAYWHNNFGHPMSHGCINMDPKDVEVLYTWAQPESQRYVTYANDTNPGTPVTIYGVTPTE